nr:cupin domain-containing protein [uncultured Cupriavidus sp.]
MSASEYTAVDDRSCGPLCRRVAAGQSSSTEPARHATSGNAFDIAVHVLSQGQTLGAAPGEAGEEVAAVLEGTFTIEAAGETYRLSKGEGIIIPSAEPRRWTCDTEGGRLYRVINRTSLQTQAGDAA